jgi:tRNA-2-methylthio-N6-dimethylallyladenosine synthase
MGFARKYFFPGPINPQITRKTGLIFVRRKFILHCLAQQRAQRCSGDLRHACKSAVCYGRLQANVVNHAVPRNPLHRCRWNSSAVFPMKEEDFRGLNRVSKTAGKRVHITTYGCQMNQHDSDTLLGILEEAGYVMSGTPEDADVILLNTCCVRDHAEQRLYGRVSQLRALKLRNADLIIGIGGCVAQKEGENLTRRFPHVDLVFGPNAVTEISSLVQRAKEGRRPVIAIPEDGESLRSDQVGSHRLRLHAWVSVMRGCDNYCSYCVVPYVRGPQRSKNPEEVEQQVRSLAEKGVVEVTLLGQNVNSYGLDLGVGVTFAQLLERLDAIPGIRRIRFTTSHPKDISVGLMHAIQRLPKVCEHIHLPVQSGSTRILELMNRRYTSDDYLRIVDQLRDLVPEISLTTDIIVGFPGESEEDFQKTRELVERVQFDGAYIFKYSNRPGTKAAQLAGALDDATITRRHRELLELQKGISQGRLKGLLNTVQSVLPDQVDSKRKGHLAGRTRGHRMASFRADNSSIGREIDISVDRLEGWTLLGKPCHGHGHHSGEGCAF